MRFSTFIFDPKTHLEVKKLDLYRGPILLLQNCKTKNILQPDFKETDGKNTNSFIKSLVDKAAVNIITKRREKERESA